MLIILFILHPQPDFLSDPETAIQKAYLLTDEKILEKTAELGRGGSTAVTAILIGSEKSEGSCCKCWGFTCSC
jgi:hypothetical protein